MRFSELWLAAACAACSCASPEATGVEELDVEVPNGKIAFGKLTPIPGGMGWSLNVVNPDGSSVARLPPGSDVPYEGDPAFSRDGKKIAFASGYPSESQIYRMNSDGSCLTQLTHVQAASYEPSWSPDGRRIAFVRRCHIYTMNADGTNVAELLPGTCQPDNGDDSPKWSPDGTRILFASSKPGNFDIFTIDVDGTGLVNLTNHSAADSYPAWSPDGTQIVFYSDRDDRSRYGELYVMDADGANLVRLTDHPGSFDQNPSWSPDGRKIAFLSNFENRGLPGSLSLYKMNPDGTTVRVITDDGWAGSAIDWGPRFDGVFASWTNIVGVSATCNSLKKAPTGQHEWDAGAATVEVLDGDGSLEFTTAENTTRKMVGLSNGDDGVDVDDIDFAFYLRDDGALVVSEGASLRRRVGSYAAGDAFRIRVADGVVTYWQNGVRLFRSRATPIFPLLVDTALRTPGATIQDVTLDPGQ